jgi:hypothetical protein
MTDGKEMREHVWQYFTVHASQRMAMLNLFLVLTGIVAAGLAACVQGQGVVRLLGGVLGIVLFLVAFVFSKLDARTSFLVKHAEQAMIHLEKEFPADEARLFALEAPKTAMTGLHAPVVKMWTYGASLRFLFWTTGIAGLGGGAVSVCRYLGVVP